jgi:guanidinoacetate N-methyltransferase
LRSSEEFKKEEWVSQEASLNEVRLDIDGHPVMQAWETPYMGELAKIATSKGGRVLEVGFGMAISATAVQSFPHDEHIIMEANKDVFKTLEEFKIKYPKVTPMGPALWQDSVSKIEDNSIDGILYDTYPLNKEEQHIHQFEFIKEAYRMLKPGGILTYCNLTSLGVLKSRYEKWEDLFEETQRPHLNKAGFSDDEILGFKVVPVTPTSDCEYYKHDTALAPMLTKNGPSGQKRSFSTSARRFSSETSAGCTWGGHVGLSPAQLAQKEIKVNCWSQWGDLNTIMVGHADYACFPPNTGGFHGEINDPIIAEWFDCPEGKKHESVIGRANAELDNLSRVLQDEGITVVRPSSVDWSLPIKTPYFEVKNQYCHTCVRDSLITIGNIVLEAPMSRRDRYFESYAFL